MVLAVPPTRMVTSFSFLYNQDTHTFNGLDVSLKNETAKSLGDHTTYCERSKMYLDKNSFRVLSLTVLTLIRKVILVYPKALISPGPLACTAWGEQRISSISIISAR